MSRSSSARGGTGGGVELLHRLVGGDGGAALEALLDGFEQRHPDVSLGDVTDENLSLEVKSRILKENPPDVWIEWPGKNLKPYDDASVLGDVSTVWESGTMERNYLDGPKEAARFEGTYRAVPINIHRINNLFYNVSQVEAVGVDPASLDSPRALAEELRRIGEETDCLGMLFPMKNPWTVLQMWETVLLGEHGLDTYVGVTDESASAHRRAVADALDIVRQYGEAAPEDKLYTSLTDANARFTRGESVFFHQGDWAAGEYADADGFGYRDDWDHVPFPGTDGLYAMNMDSVVSAAETENPEAVSTFLGYVGSADGQKRFNQKKGSIPPRTDVDTDAFTPFLQDQQTAFQRSRDQPLSITHGLGVRPAQLIELKTAMSTFVSTWDVDAVADEVVAAFDARA
ncbi:ABC transporter substrate-binding protein [Haloarcula nitratireducens]|uniref:ABC transporter substrate-binding protein n=1 Tax=Haloarcula nitratireducens TaxID=2487749 RepID=A0AAW4P8B2_9EURY|nr:ABC transporter substrate-binding protein [Halomicroarcula nitratireducens]MBX0294121.1 ABC transporter substrate-binding protein [Halomicroarcula nitratireducens]